MRPYLSVHRLLHHIGSGKGWRDLLLILFVVPALYLSYVWLKQI